ncbi:MAG: hypothetical protein LBU83_03910 [Bacteroidales bacterium]|jgi:hypothetical protein|nr:hypothetical protein [Bacteroidales bacterium]
MKYLNKNQETQNINAETLLSLWEDLPHLKVCYESLFARNYSEDMLRIVADRDSTTVFLSQNGIYHLLPKGLFFTENQLNEEKKRRNDFKSAYDKMKKQKKEAQSFFQPFDTELFRLVVESERKINTLFFTGNKIWLSELPEVSKNEYINKLIPLLPYASRLRGNIQLLIDLLRFVFEVEKIEIRELKPFYSRFIIHKEGLSREQYLAMNEEVKSFFEFFSHWFLPVEKEYDFRIKDLKHTFILEKGLALDYNTNV